MLSVSPQSVQHTLQVSILDQKGEKQRESEGWVLSNWMLNSLTFKWMWSLLGTSVPRLGRWPFPGTIV